MLPSLLTEVKMCEDTLEGLYFPCLLLCSPMLISSPLRTIENGGIL